MKKIKNIIIFFLMMFAFSFSFEDSKIELAPKKKEPAKLTIGVHKLKSKPLPMDFDKKNKLIYGEINITDDQVVYVSESLNEIPSLTTSSGRRVVNNIKKYLTRDIKEAPKFNYQVKTDEESGKKYLLIKCKAPLENVYVYVVEKGSYHVKEVYKGQFNLVDTLEEREKYGTVHIGNGRGVFLNGKTIKYDRTTNQVILSIGEGQAQSVTIFGQIEGGKYPEKFIPKNIEDFYNPTSNRYPIVKIKLNDIEVGEQKFEKETEIENFKQGIFTIDGIRVNTVQPSTRGLAGTLKIFTSTESENKYNGHIKIFLKDWFEYGNTKSDIVIQYGTVDKDGNNWQVLREDSFGLKIDSRDNSIGDTTEGGLIFTKEHKLGQEEGTITFDSNSAYFNGSKKSYLKFSGKAPKKVKGLPSTPENLAKIKIVSTSIDEKGNTIETKLAETNIDENGDFSTGDIEIKAKKIVENDSGEDEVQERVAGKVKFYMNDKSEYLQIDIKNWKRFSGDVSENIKFSYIATDGKNTTTVVKTDILDFGVNAPEENIPPETEATFRVYEVAYINNAEILLKDEGPEVIKDDGENWFNPKTQSISTGEFPKKFIVNTDEVDWGDSPNQRWVQVREVGSENYYTSSINSQTGEYKFTNIKMTNSNKKSLFDLWSTVADNNLYIKFHDFANTTPTLQKSFEIRYVIGEQKQVQDGKGRIIKRDYLNIAFNPDWKFKESIIKVNNPIVWYDYNSSSATSNIAHNRRVHMANGEEKTLNRNGGIFTKNTQTDGSQWIKGENLVDYDANIGRHRINIITDKGEVTKYTKDNGGTNSSTFINLNEGSNVMFSYDGGNKYLNFGVAKYEFKNTPQTAEVIIIHEGRTDLGSKIKVELPAFDGRPYVSPSYDIQPEKDYIKAYQFDDEIGSGEVTIDYGTVGFKDLDIRITKQSGGDGIELRAYEMVDLINETGTYTIKGAKLSFDGGIREKADIKSNRTYFKGEDEKSTFKNLKLWIPTQENLIPKSRFRIVKIDTKDESPLEVGVSVRNGEEFYKPVADLYLDLTDNRFVDTEIIFENPQINLNEDGHWIKLNKKDFTTGELVTTVDNGKLPTSIWGKVKGTVIDIPTKIKDLDVRLDVFIEDAGNEISKANDFGRKVKKIEFPLKGNNINNSKFVLGYESGKDFLAFTLTNGYDENNLPDSFTFYIRYSTIDSDKTSHFYFDQRYTIKFDKKKDYLGDTTIRLKNPAMLSSTAVLNGGLGQLLLTKSETRGAKPLDSKDNVYAYDIGEWFESINSIIYPANSDGTDVKGYNLKSLTGSGAHPWSEIDFDENTKEMTISLSKKLYDYLGMTNSIQTGKEASGSFEVEFIENGSSEKYRINIEVDRFDPRYYGKVYPKDEVQNRGEEYKERNNVGIGDEDLYSSSTDTSDGYRYIDLGTSYRDYARYKGIRELIATKNMQVGTKGEVDIIPKDNETAIPIKGTIVFEDGSSRNERVDVKPLEDIQGDNNTCPKSYSLKVKVTQEDYNKLQQNTLYSLYLNGNKNTLSIGYFDKNDNILLRELELEQPLSFKTRSAGIEVDAEILDFGNIGLNFVNGENIITQEGKTKVTVKSSTISMDRIELEVESSETDLFYVVGEEENGQVDESIWLDVTDLKVEKQQTLQRQNTQIENYELSGVVNVENNENTKLGVYNGNVILNIILNPPQTK